MLVAPILESVQPVDQPGLTIGLIAAWYLPGVVVLNLTEQRPAYPETASQRFSVSDLGTGATLPPAGGGGGGGIFGTPQISHSRLMWFFQSSRMPQEIQIRSTSGTVDISLRLTPITRQRSLDFVASEIERPSKQLAHRLLNTQAAVGMLPDSVECVEPVSFDVHGVSVVPFALEQWSDSKRVWFQAEPDQPGDVERLFEAPMSDLGLRLNGSQGITHTGHQGAAGTQFSLVFSTTQR